LATRSRAKSFILFSATLMLVLFSRGSVCAQDLDDVSFAGTVADQNGAVLPGATVTATLLSTKSERTATTDGEGRYRLVELQPGAQRVRARLQFDEAIEDRHHDRRRS